MLKDLRHAARMLVHAKGWTAVVVLSLGLGIGANTALFSAANGMLLTKVPARDADSLVRIRWMGKNDMVTSSSDYGFVAKITSCSVSTRGSAGSSCRTTTSRRRRRSRSSARNTGTRASAPIPPSSAR